MRIPDGQFEYYFLKLSNIRSGSGARQGEQHEKAPGKRAKQNDYFMAAGRVFVFGELCENLEK